MSTEFPKSFQIGRLFGLQGVFDRKGRLNFYGALVLSFAGYFSIFSFLHNSIPRAEAQSAYVSFDPLHDCDVEHCAVSYSVILHNLREAIFRSQYLPIGQNPPPLERWSNSIVFKVLRSSEIFNEKALSGALPLVTKFAQYSDVELLIHDDNKGRNPNFIISVLPHWTDSDLRTMLERVDWEDSNEKDNLELYFELMKATRTVGEKCFVDTRSTITSFRILNAKIFISDEMTEEQFSRCIYGSIMSAFGLGGDSSWFANSFVGPMNAAQPTCTDLAMAELFLSGALPLGMSLAEYNNDAPEIILRFLRHYSPNDENRKSIHCIVLDQ